MFRDENNEKSKDDKRKKRRIHIEPRFARKKLNVLLQEITDLLDGRDSDDCALKEHSEEIFTASNGFPYGIVISYNGFIEEEREKDFWNKFLSSLASRVKKNRIAKGAIFYPNASTPYMNRIGNFIDMTDMEEDGVYLLLDFHRSFGREGSSAGISIGIKSEGAFTTFYSSLAYGNPFSGLSFDLDKIKEQKGLFTVGGRTVCCFNDGFNDICFQYNLDHCNHEDESSYLNRFSESMKKHVEFVWSLCENEDIYNGIGLMRTTIDLGQRVCSKFTCAAMSVE